MAKPVDDKFLDPTRPIREPTTYVRGRTGGKLLYIIAKLQAGLPLSALDRDIILEALRKQWLTKKEHAAFLRQAKLKSIEAARRVAEEATNLKGKREQWVREGYGYPTPEAMKQFIKRERKRRRH